MNNFAENFIIRHPSLEDAQAVVDFMIACDIVTYGEPDSDLESLLDEWSDIDLNRDVWLVIAPDKQIIGYAAVFKGDQRFTFNIYVHPVLAPASLNKDLLTQCEARAFEQIDPRSNTPVIATIYIAHVNLAERQAAEELEYQLTRYHYGMRINLTSPPPEPLWPDGITLRNAVAGQDDRQIYDFIQAAFDWPGRNPPTFEGWHDLMLGASNFDSNLWFLAYHGDELVGAALCFDYPYNGWVRQLGVTQTWRRQGLGGALLQYVFGVFYRRGHTRVGLVVESDNPKAYQFYENVGMTLVQQYADYRKTLSIL